MITEIKNFNLKPFNTFGMDVTCNEWIEYTAPSDLYEISNRLESRQFKHIGAGSNILFTGDYHGTVIHSRILDVEYLPHDSQCVLIKAGAGIILDELIAQCAAAGLWGLENLSGVPGEVGASAIQNVGAYGTEAKDVIQSVECFDTVTRNFITFSCDDCKYGYRTSLFKHEENRNRYIVTHVTYRLSRASRPNLGYGNLEAELSGLTDITPMDVRNAVIAIRSRKLPDVETTGSAGSYFKNPVIDMDAYRDLCAKVYADSGCQTEVPHYPLGNKMKIPAAWLIDQSGLKGYKCGNAAIWHLQPLVIVNATGKATPQEIVAMEQKVITTVYTRLGIMLHPEVEHI